MHNLKHHLGSTALSFRDTVQQLECYRIQIKRFAQKHLKRNEVKKKRGLVKDKSKSKSAKREKGGKKKRYRGGEGESKAKQGKLKDIEG